MNRASAVSERPSIAPLEWGKWRFSFDRPVPYIMGILNATPDSFSDGGLYAGVDQAVEQGLRMEEEGVNIDEKLLAGLSKECEVKIEDLHRRLYKLAGTEFNLNSPRQMAQILFEKLKLPTIKKTKTGFSTDEGVLVKLAKHHELPALILEYRRLAKLKSTYIDSLPKLINPKTGRVHTTFHQAVM